MSFYQKLGLFVLILISCVYVFLSLSGKNVILPDFINKKTVLQPSEEQILTETSPEETLTAKPQISKSVKIYILDKSGELRSVNRTCISSNEDSCYEYAIKELVKAPTKWEKSKGFTSEIPQGTKVLSVRKSNARILLDLSADFEVGGGTESTYMRIKQLIKTVNENSSLPTYLYINGKLASVLGSEGIMIKQPLNGGSLDE